MGIRLAIVPAEILWLRSGISSRRSAGTSTGRRPRIAKMKSSHSFWLVVVALTGCQGALPGISGLGQPGRVPPPATGSYQVPGAYSGGAGKSLGAASSTAAPPSLGVAPAGSPWVDQVASAQNQLKQATDSARAAVFDSTQNIQNQVDQAASRADRISAGVVQASQVLSDAAVGPLPAGGSVPVSASSQITDSVPSGSLSDQAPAPPIESNPQWRKPTPR